MVKRKTRKKATGKTFLYKISIGGITRYIGITNNLSRRQKEHNKGLSGGDTKELYCFCREEGIENIELIQLEEFSTRVECKRKECFYILADHFTSKKLKQSVPCISDRASSKK